MQLDQKRKNGDCAGDLCFLNARPKLYVLSSKLVVCRWHGRRARGEVPRDARCHGKGGARWESEVLCADTALVGRHVQRLDGWMDRSVYDATGYAPEVHRLSLCMHAS